MEGGDGRGWEGLWPSQYWKQIDATDCVKTEKTAGRPWPRSQFFIGLEGLKAYERGWAPAQRTWSKRTFFFLKAVALAPCSSGIGLVNCHKVGHDQISSLHFAVLFRRLSGKSYPENTNSPPRKIGGQQIAKKLSTTDSSEARAREAWL